MTYKELLKIALKDPWNWEENPESLKLMQYAYYAGEERATKIICDKARKIFSEQREKAKQCRYHNMAEQIIGKQTMIYSVNYSGDFTELFGDDIISEKVLSEIKNREEQT